MERVANSCGLLNLDSFSAGAVSVRVSIELLSLLAAGNPHRDTGTASMLHRYRTAGGSVFTMLATPAESEWLSRLPASGQRRERILRKEPVMPECP